MRQLQRSIAHAFDGCSGKSARVGPLYATVNVVFLAAGNKSCRLLTNTVYSLVLALFGYLWRAGFHSGDSLNQHTLLCQSWMIKLV